MCMSISDCLFQSVSAELQHQLDELKDLIEYDHQSLYDDVIRKTDDLDKVEIEGDHSSADVKVQFFISLLQDLFIV